MIQFVLLQHYIIFSGLVSYVQISGILSLNLSIFITEPLVNRFATRRKSVFAETYDPENDADEDEGAAAIFPKSDEQRTRLIESVKNILLFRSLDKDQVSLPHFIGTFLYNYNSKLILLYFSSQMNQVLDAMFERKVTVDEIVIRQGDDGDNFYVIES